MSQEFTDELKAELLTELKDQNIKDLKEIPIENIAIGEWVLLKCKFGCNSYNTNYACTPASFPVEQFKRMIKGYKKALLVIGDGSGIPQQNRFIEGLTELEKKLFLKNFYKAFALTSGPCQRCEICTYPDKPCIFPEKVRPAAESVGIDIFQTVKNSGIDINVLAEEQEFNCYGIILLE